jgi:hypothetical protein
LDEDTEAARIADLRQFVAHRWKTGHLSTKEKDSLLGVLRMATVKDPTRKRRGRR